MNNMRNKILSLLVLLLTAATGAWAQEPTVKEITSTITSTWQDDNAYLAACMPDDFVAIDKNVAGAWKDAPKSGYSNLIYDTDGNKIKYVTFSSGAMTAYWEIDITIFDTKSEMSITKFYYTTGTAEPPIEVSWNAATKQGTFTMPGSDVMLTPVYAPAAAFATSGEPTAIDGIIAGEAKAIVNEGTVAKAGSTENAQGTVMYYATANQMTADQVRGIKSSFSSTVPTGAVLTGGFDKDQTVYVWYYIQGANTPDGQTATADNTFNDSEICATPLTVTLKANQFNLTFSPAPVSNATVTVGGTAATAEQLNAGKIEKVGTGTEIKLKAATGYKFKKVEVKKTTQPD